MAAESQGGACQNILQCFAGRQSCVRKHTAAHTHSQRQRSKHNTVLLHSQVQGRPEAPIDVNYNAWCSELDVSGHACSTGGSQNHKVSDRAVPGRAMRFSHALQAELLLTHSSLRQLRSKARLKAQQQTCDAGDTVAVRSQVNQRWVKSACMFVLLFVGTERYSHGSACCHAA